MAQNKKMLKNNKFSKKRHNTNNNTKQYNLMFAAHVRA